MSNTLYDKLNNILTQKNNFITPENLKPGINVFNVVSNMTNYGDLNIIPNTIGGIINSGYVNSINISAVNASIDANITPENIANGVNILGVIGNMSTSENLEDVIAEQENIIANLSNAVNEAAGLPPFEMIFPANTRVSFANSTFNKVPSWVGYNTFSLQNNLYAEFSCCRSLRNIPNFDTSNVTNMSNMFESCYYLDNVPNFNTSNVTNMSRMFSLCAYNLVNVSNFDTSNVTSMSSMFSSCSHIKSVPNFNTSNVKIIGYMLWCCSNLISVPNFNTSNATNTEAMLYSCNNLTDVPNFDISNAIKINNMFCDCTKLINVPEYSIPKADGISNMFYNCNNLSNESIQNIVNMCISAINITNSQLKNLSNMNVKSPLYNTKFDSTYYSNRLEELTAAGWSY